MSGELTFENIENGTLTVVTRPKKTDRVYRYEARRLAGTWVWIDKPTRHVLGVARYRIDEPVSSRVVPRGQTTLQDYERPPSQTDTATTAAQTAR